MFQPVPSRRVTVPGPPSAAIGSGSFACRGGIVQDPVVGHDQRSRSSRPAAGVRSVPPSWRCISSRVRRRERRGGDVERVDAVRDAALPDLVAARVAQERPVAVARCRCASRPTRPLNLELGRDRVADAQLEAVLDGVVDGAGVAAEDRAPEIPWGRCRTGSPTPGWPRPAPPGRRRLALAVTLKYCIGCEVESWWL